MTALAKISPWLARPLSDAVKDAKFRATLDQHAERQLLGHIAIKAGWMIGGIGVVSLAASIFGWVTILPLKQTEVRFYLVDKTSGYVGPATTIADAPALFTEVHDHEYLERFLNACEGWIPELDRANDYLCKLMSRRDQQERYAAWRKLPTSPIAAVGKDGHVDLHNYRFHPICGTASTESCGAKNSTRRYLVQYDRTVWKGGKGDTKTWSATVDFQWHPELTMRQADRDLNAGGFQSIAINTEPDAG